MSAYYPEELLEEIRMSNDIVDVVSEYVKLDKKGKYYFGLCPFHKEKTASFTVTPSRQIFNCFGCGKGGNVYHFIMNVENLDFLEAVRMLAERAKIDLPERGRVDTEKIELKKKIIDINRSTARFFYNTLASPKGLEGRKYLEKRHIAAATAKKFGIGFSEKQGDSLLRHLKGMGYGEDEILKSGLVLEGKNGCYDRFRGRVMFPILDIRGNIIGFGGRVVDSSVKPKYMNSPETAVYNKRRNLYGLNIAKNSSEGRVVVVEGYMDVISLYQSGIICSVASLGTSLTENQGRLLKKYFNEVIIAYDADTAGMNAAMRGLELLDEMGCDVKVLRIPEGKDPDEYINIKGAEAFHRLMDNALSLVDYKIAVNKKRHDDGSTEGKIRFINSIADVLSRVENRVEIEMYVKKLAQEYGIRKDSLYEEVLKKKNLKHKKNRTTAKFVENGKDTIRGGGNSTSNTAMHYEMMLLAILSLDNSVYDYIKSNISLEDFTCDTIAKAARTIFDRLENNYGVVPAEVLNILDKKEAEMFSAIVEKECNFDENKKPVDIVRRIKTNCLEKKRNEIKRELRNRDNMEKGDVKKLEQELNGITLKIARL